MSKGVKMTLSEFVGNPDFGDWADDMDLPTAPTSYSYNNAGVEQRTMNEPPKPLPDHPPFVAFFGNLSFEIQEQDIDIFLKEISDVSLFF
jgi:translation initiation factor 4B